MRYTFINGNFFLEEDARLSARDLGLLRGHAVFDFFRVIEGKPLFLTAYIDRFYRSATGIGLAVGYTKSSLASFITTLIGKSALQYGGIRLLLTGGNSPDGISSTIPNLVIFSEVIKDLPATVYIYGARLLLSNYLRDVPLIKHTNYLKFIKMRGEIHAKDAIDVLYTYKGEVLESSRSNCFIVKDGIIITPKRDVLLGITREVVMTASRKYYTIKEQTVTIETLLQADEVFITSSMKKVVPVIKIGDTTIANGKPGPITQHIIQLFEQAVKSYLQNYTQV